MKVYKPKDKLPQEIYGEHLRIFLAGTIDSGNSRNWQAEIERDLAFSSDSIEIFNPRNDVWNNSIEQTIENSNFRHQLQWEFDALCKADIIFMNFLEDSKSPITMLELGLFADTDKLVICCPKGFWRRGNIEFIAELYAIPLFEDEKDALLYIKECINEQ